MVVNRESEWRLQLETTGVELKLKRWCRNARVRPSFSSLPSQTSGTSETFWSIQAKPIRRAPQRLVLSNGAVGNHEKYSRHINFRLNAIFRKLFTSRLVFFKVLYHTRKRGIEAFLPFHEYFCQFVEIILIYFFDMLLFRNVIIKFIIILFFSFKMVVSDHTYFSFHLLQNPYY